MSLPELVVALAIGAILLVAGTVVSVPWLAREASRGALHDVRVMLQTARMEAVRRNHPCSFEIDLGTRTMRVVDMNDTSTTTDDVTLRSRRLPEPVAVARPDVGAPITFELVTGSVYRVVYDSRGSVTGGTGELVLYGGERYGRVCVYSAGGVRNERWNGTSWTTDS